MTIEDALKKAIERSAEIVVKEIKDKLDSGKYPSVNDAYRSNYTSIQDSIKIGEPKQEGNDVSIEITIGGENAPYAAAYEYGSGLHSELGDRKTYPIKAKNVKALAFYWKKIGMRTLVPRADVLTLYEPPDTLVIRKGQVDHPGIRPNSYIRPSLETRSAGPVQVSASQRF